MATPKSGATAPIKLDPEQVTSLAGIGCTLNEMAAFFKCSVDTLTRNYADAIEAGRETGKVSVRRMMWDQGRKGNSVALKYLVHNVLKEKIEEFHVEHSEPNEIVQKLSSISSAAILQIVEGKTKKEA